MEQRKKQSLSSLKRDQTIYWNNHYWQTREVVVAAVGNGSCFNVDLAALYENQGDIGTNFGQLTRSSRAGISLTAALVEHIRIAVLIVVALINKQPIADLYKTWQSNATAIATIYAKYNCCISFKVMNKMMQQHLSTTAAEVVAIVSKDCADGYKKGEIALDHITMMSSYINSKFPCYKSPSDDRWQKPKKHRKSHFEPQHCTCNLK